MNRPYVNLKSKNIVEDLLKILEEKLPKFMALDGVIGITLNGGMSRGYADFLSEIDVVIYLNSEEYERWQKSKAPIPLGIVKLDGYLYDIKIVDFEAEKGRKWDSVALWDLSYSKILFDPEGNIEKLVKEKLLAPKSSEAEGLLFSCWWYYRLACDIWIHRGDALQGHFILNKAIIPLIEALFIANTEFIPHEKWLIHMSRTLNWKPKLWEQRLGEAMNTGDLSIDSLTKRQHVIEDIWEDIDNYLRQKECPGLKLNFDRKSCYESLKYLVDRDSVTIEEWNTRSSISALNYDPLYNITFIENGRIVVDKDKLLATKPEDMYYWMFDILKVIVEEM